MNGIEHARHDLNDASFSVDTAIDVLTGLVGEQLAHAPELSEVIRSLESLKGDLERSRATLERVSVDSH